MNKIVDFIPCTVNESSLDSLRRRFPRAYAEYQKHGCLYIVEDLIPGTSMYSLYHMDQRFIGFVSEKNVTLITKEQEKME